MSVNAKLAKRITKKNILFPIYAVYKQLRVRFVQSMLALSRRLEPDIMKGSCFSLYTNTNNYKYVPRDGQWHHYALTYDGWIRVDPDTQVRDDKRVEAHYVDQKKVYAELTTRGSDFTGLLEAIDNAVKEYAEKYGNKNDKLKFNNKFINKKDKKKKTRGTYKITLNRKK